jgi:tetratricopeptide (TPR) repeat protein
MMMSEKVKTFFGKVKDKLKPEDIAKFAAKEAVGAIPIVGQIIKDAFDEFSPDEKEELIKELKDLSESQFKEISEEVGVSVKYLEDIQKFSLYTFKELRADHEEIKKLLLRLIGTVETPVNVIGGAGITAGDDVSIGDVTGQFAIGKYITQVRIEKPSGEALVKLIDFLDQKRQESVNKEILKSYTPSALPDYPPRLRAFVTENRVDELTQALRYLQDHRILLISGVGGVGKTTLARALVETRPANVPLPFWFDFSKNIDVTLGDVLEKLASYMNTSDIAKFKAEGKEAGQKDINRLTGELQNREPAWLVFDNLEIILEGRHFHDQGIASLFTALRDSTHLAKIIVTSRILPILGDGESFIDVIEEEKQELKGLRTNFAVDYLTKNGLENVAREKLEELAKGVDGHPLALKLLVGVVKAFGVADTLNDLSVYQKRKEDTIKKARRLFDKLAGDEKELLERISVYRQPELRDAIKKMFTDKTPVDAMEKLIDKSLLETDHEGSYWLHPLVREFSYDDLEDKREAHKVAVQYYLSLPVPEERSEKADIQSLIEACYHACMAGEYDKAAGIIFDNELHEDLDRWGNSRTLIELYEKLLPESFDEEPKLTIIQTHGSILGSLGLAYADLGQVERAIEFYKQALSISKDIDDRRNEGTWLGSLGTAYYGLGQVKRQRARKPWNCLPFFGAGGACH